MKARCYPSAEKYMTLLFVAFYFAVLLALCTYGIHRAHLVLMLWRFRHRTVPAAVANAPACCSFFPHVTIQLPLYNEATVVDRLLVAAGAIDYPRDRFEIQVLDDSSDETRVIAQRKVQELCDMGLDAVYVRRPNRDGYKAGALDYGLATAKGELIAVFDADFIPQPEFLRAVVGHFADPEVGMVQTRWGHLNRDHSLLTGTQALMLDGHHLVENRARFAAGCFFNFSGTGGIWRRAAIETAGGWQHDTLTEDLDLSYRAQLAGWRFVYRADVVTPAELPEDMSALRAQQFRWAKGTVQTARKLLPVILKADIGTGRRLEAMFHMTPHFAYPLMMLLSVLLLPALWLMPATDFRTMLIVDLPLCLGATGSLVTFYAAAERAQGRGIWGAIKRMPALIALGVGLSPHLSNAVFEGMRDMAGEFVRTPKRGRNLGRYRQRAQLPIAEALLAAVCLASVVMAFATSHWFAIPFAGLFAWGYCYVAFRIVLEQLQARRDSLAPASGTVNDGGMDVDPTGMARAA
jgi:cellulose synthase/poly-beta-1,6-N-acetylglucosamine synthase-like glycosyltransferase